MSGRVASIACARSFRIVVADGRRPCSATNWSMSRSVATSMACDREENSSPPGSACALTWPVPSPTPIRMPGVRSDVWPRSKDERARLLQAHYAEAVPCRGWFRPGPVAASFA